MSEVRDMSPAEFKTAHESLGVSTAFLAERCGVHPQRIWKYEGTDRTLPVPEAAAEVMRGLLIDFDESATHLETLVNEQNEGWIPRHVDLAQFEEMLPAMTGWGRTAQGLVIAEVQRRLQVAIEYVS